MVSAHKIYLYSCTTLHLICSAGLCWHMPVRYQITEEMFSLFACIAGLYWHMHVCCLVPNYRRDVQFVRMQCRLMLAHACLVPNYRSDVQFICSHAVDLVKDDDSMHAKTGLEHWMVRQQN